MSRSEPWGSLAELRALESSQWLGRFGGSVMQPFRLQLWPPPPSLLALCSPLSLSLCLDPAQPLAPSSLFSPAACSLSRACVSCCVLQMCRWNTHLPSPLLFSFSHSLVEGTQPCTTPSLPTRFFTWWHKAGASIGCAPLL